MADHSQQENTTSSFAWFSAPECIAWITVLGMEGAVTVTLNTLTIIVYLKERSLRKRNMFLVINQAVADMSVGASVISEFFISGEVCGFWKIHHVSKPITFILWFVFSPASFTNLTAISLDRAHATFRPFKHRFLKKKIFGAVIAAIWITAWLFASIRVLYEIQILTFERYKHFFVSCFSLCLFCLLIITVSYSSIAIKNVSGTQPHHHGATTKERKLTKTLFILTVVSSLLALPSIIFKTCEMFALPSLTMISAGANFRLNYSFVVLFYANSIVNPIFYAFKMPDFRRALFSFLPVDPSHNCLLRFSV